MRDCLDDLGKKLKEVGLTSIGSGGYRRLTDRFEGTASLGMANPLSGGMRDGLSGGTRRDSAIFVLVGDLIMVGGIIVGSNLGEVCCEDDKSRAIVYDIRKLFAGSSS
ncbi:hypothetical protein Tco_1262175 [Tanacetum coccineum]